ncbi:hypothetical protein [Kutzneria albida]|uniref:hypothetical protein n=1 Tax=Kutzneria albida TaxID=43357 RepID=UPI0011DDDC2F|nr:hypothetical protein [Kutzneria albida]
MTHVNVVVARDITGGVNFGGARRRLAGVLPHEQMVRRLSTVQDRTVERPEFVSPGIDHASDPRNLLDTLRARRGGRGIVLIGAAGTGKSRTCFEVAELAVREGMRALYVLSSEHTVTAEDLIEAVTAEPGEVLVVIDYLNDCHGFAYSELRTRVAPAARAEGVTVHVLASARPGWKQAGDLPEVKQEFDLVELRVDRAHHRAVCAAILEVEAKTALGRYDRERVERACGHKPVIAKLIAREIERHALAGAELVAERSGDLLGWLLRMFASYQLLVPPSEDPLRPVPPGERVRGAVAVVAACPQPRDAVEQVAATVLDGDPVAAQGCVDMLLRMGWVEQEEVNLVVVHDIVVDTLLAQTLLDEFTDRVREQFADTLLAPAVRDARTASRFVLHLNRLTRDLAEGRARHLAEYCQRWLRGNAVDLGATLLEEAQASGFALGTLLNGEPWAEAAIECWSELVGPWLAKYGRTQQARHLYAKGLYMAPAERASYLAEDAITWLTEHGTKPNAAFVLSGLLHQNGLGPHKHIVTRHALDWARRHSERVEAQFVLTSLLVSVEPGHERTLVVEFARRWLKHHHGRDDARYVLGLLIPLDLGLATKEILARALTWLELHSGAVASMVLSALLRARGTVATERALSWLAEHHKLPAAHHVLQPLLASGEAGELIGWTVAWLRDNLHRFSGGFLLKVLLDRELGAHEAEVLGLAVRWLGANRTEQVAGHVLVKLIARTDLGDQRPVVLAHTDAWLRLYNESHFAADTVIAALITADCPNIVEHGVAWLADNRKNDKLPLVATALLTRRDLGSHLDLVQATAFRWLVTHQANKHADLVRAGLCTGTATDLDAALAWLDRRGRVPAAGPLIRHLALYTETDTAEYALAWLGAHGAIAEDGLLLKRLLADERTAERVVPVVLAWFDTEEIVEHEPHLAVLLPLLQLDRHTERPEVRDRALRWLDSHDTGQDEVLALLLQRADLAPVREPVLRHAFTWVRANPADRDAYHVLSRLLACPHLGDQAAAAIDLACGWLRVRTLRSRDCFVLSRLLAREDLGERADEAVEHAVRWLDRNPSSASAGAVLGPLLARPELGRHVPFVAECARRWLDSAPAEHSHHAAVEDGLAQVVANSVSTDHRSE